MKKTLSRLNEALTRARKSNEAPRDAANFLSSAANYFAPRRISSPIFRRCKKPYEMRSFLHARRARANVVMILPATRASMLYGGREALDSARFDAKIFFWITSLNRVSTPASRSKSSESAADRFAHASSRATFRVARSERKGAPRDAHDDDRTVARRGTHDARRDGTRATDAFDRMRGASDGSGCVVRPYRAAALSPRQSPSLALSRSLTACGFALPPEAFITWPTNQPSSFGLALACATLSGLAAMMSAT